MGHLALSIDSIGLIGGILRVIGLLWCIYLLLCDYMANIWIYWIIYYLNVYVSYLLMGHHALTPMSIGLIGG